MKNGEPVEINVAADSSYTTMLIYKGLGQKTRRW
jgi:hypothetical protein